MAQDTPNNRTLRHSFRELQDLTEQLAAYTRKLDILSRRLALLERTLINGMSESLDLSKPEIWNLVYEQKGQP